MADQLRDQWSHRIDQVLRSRHYTWLAGGLAGEPVELALTNLTADIMHICERQGIDWETLVEKSRNQFEQEEVGVSHSPVSVA